jgi:hypothetical protein
MKTSVFDTPDRFELIRHLDYGDSVIVISLPVTGDGGHQYSLIMDAAGTVGYVYRTNIV